MDNKLITIFENQEKQSKHRIIIEKKMWNIDDCYFEFDVQCKILNNPNETPEIYLKMLNQINNKISSYKSQDKKKKQFDKDKFIDTNAIINLMKECQLKCFYCKESVKILYKIVKEEKQWSAERIDNNYGHNKDNIKIACLACKLKRRTMYFERYAFTKQLNIIKNDI
jgi:hypothetical protein